MLPHIRAMIAASVCAFLLGRKVAGLYDHQAGRHLRVAAESQGEHLQGYDGERGTRFGGTLPELYDAGDGVFVSLEIAGDTAQGYDRGSGGFYTARLADRTVQLFDHIAGSWFAYTVQTA